MKTLAAALLCLPLAALAGPAKASPPAAPPVEAVAPAPTATQGRLLLAPKLGVFLPTSSLGAAFFVGAEVGWVTPALDDRLAVVLDLSWSRPKAKGSLTGARGLATGVDGAWDLGVSEFAVQLSAVFRQPDVGLRGLTLYGGLGPSLVYARAAITSFSQVNLETETKPGFQFLCGAELNAGPGAAFLELRYLWTKVDFRSTGDANVGGFPIAAGYRFRISVL